MKRKQIAILLSSSLGLLYCLSGCVTVNVNFPESAVQKATDDYVRDLYRAKEKGKTPPPSTPNTPQSSTGSRSPLLPLSRSPFPPVKRQFAPLINEAFAEDSRVDVVEFRVNTEKALKIRDKLASQLSEVLAQKRSGTLGETNDGFLTLKGADKLKPLLQKKIQTLLENENSDRGSLYDEVLSSNGIEKSRRKDIQRSFSRSFQAESPSGTWVQDSDGKWDQKP